MHRRTNRYHAELALLPQGEVFKISGIELLSEERVDQN